MNAQVAQTVKSDLHTTSMAE